MNACTQQHHSSVGGCLCVLVLELHTWSNSLHCQRRNIANSTQTKQGCNALAHTQNPHPTYTKFKIIECTRICISANYLATVKILTILRIFFVRTDATKCILHSTTNIYSIRLHIYLHDLPKNSVSFQHECTEMLKYCPLYWNNSISISDLFVSSLLFARNKNQKKIHEDLVHAEFCDK